MLWISKLSGMENEKIINEGAQSEIDKDTNSAIPNLNENNSQSDASLWQHFITRKLLFSIVRSIFIIICSQIYNDVQIYRTKI